MRYAGHNTWPKSCACTFTTLMPTKRLLPRLLVSLVESSSTAVLQADCYVIDPFLHMSISALHPSLRLFCFLPVARLASLAVRCRMDLTHFWVVWGGGGRSCGRGRGGSLSFLSCTFQFDCFGMTHDAAAFVCDAEPPSWALIIQGKLIEPQAPGLAGQLSAPPVYQPPSQPFTHYIRRLTAKLDSEQYSDGEEQVVWHKSQHTRNHRDSFEIRLHHLSFLSARLCIIR